MTAGGALAGKRVVVTRPRHQAGPLVQALESEGAAVLVAPAIEIVPPKDTTPLDEALRALDRGEFDWLVVTSANAVEATLDRLTALSLQLPDGLRIAAVGPKTRAALRERGAEADVVPERFVAEEVFRALAETTPLAGARMLLPRADIAKDLLRQRLREAGADARAVTAYRTVSASGAIEETRERVAAGEVDVVTFTSASTAQGFLGGVDRERLSGRFEAASIGPVTTAAIEELGYRVSIEADPSTVEGLVAAIVAFYAR